MTEKENQLGDSPIEQAYHAKMNAVARELDELFNGQDRPKKNGFILMVFPFGTTEGRCNYVSNAYRKDVIKLLREQLARFEEHEAQMASEGKEDKG